MTHRNRKVGWLGETLPLLCLFAGLALFVSFASPADDDLQQESAPCCRYLRVTLSKATHAADVVVRTNSSTAAVVAGRQVLPHLPAWVSATIGCVLLPDRIYVQQSGDLPPPRFPL
jgi:hypothetical protein